MGRQSVVLGDGWFLFFFLVGIDLRLIVPKSKSNPASCRAPPLGERAGPSLALGLTIQMFVFLTLRK